MELGYNHASIVQKQSMLQQQLYAAKEQQICLLNHIKKLNEALTLRETETTNAREHVHRLMERFTKLCYSLS